MEVKEDEEGGGQRRRRREKGDGERGGWRRRWMEKEEEGAEPLMTIIMQLHHRTLRMKKSDPLLDDNFGSLPISSGFEPQTQKYKTLLDGILSLTSHPSPPNDTFQGGGESQRLTALIKTLKMSK